MNDKHTLNEDAKNDWFKLVNKHKKKQKGLPALSVLNTDAGDVEKGIEMFNNSTQSDCVTVGESITNVAKHSGKSDLKEDLSEYVDIEYEDLCIVKSDPYDASGVWDTEICVDWTFSVKKEHVVTFLYEECITEQDYPKLYEDSIETVVRWIEDNFDGLFDKYSNIIKEHWEEDAQKDASENYDENNYIDWDRLPGGHDYNNDRLFETFESDDDFDMSMRTLI